MKAVLARARLRQPFEANQMRKGHSGAAITVDGDWVTKQMLWPNDATRAVRLIELRNACSALEVLPSLRNADENEICMQFIVGKEGLESNNATRVGQAMRMLHEYNGMTVPVTNGVSWLVAMANNVLHPTCNLQVPADFSDHWPLDSTVHGEPVQLIEETNGHIVFIDFDGMGRGSKYQDLGYVRYQCDLYLGDSVWNSFIDGYGSNGLNSRRTEIMAGICSLAYANFYDKDIRISYGLNITGLEQGGELDALTGASSP